MWTVARDNGTKYLCAFEYHFTHDLELENACCSASQRYRLGGFNQMQTCGVCVSEVAKSRWCSVLKSKEETFWKVFKPSSKIFLDIK